MRQRHLAILLLVLISLTASGIELPPVLGKTEEFFLRAFEHNVIDFDMDEMSRLYLLTETEDSVGVSVLGFEGDIIETFYAYKGETPKPRALQIIVSNDGKVMLIRGEDIEVKTPINWVLNEHGVDILPFDHLLKYAEWLHMSPSGNFFTAQGYDRLSTIGDVFDIGFNKVEWRGRVFYSGICFGSEDGEDIVLFLEADTAGTSLAMAKLLSQEAYFSRHIMPTESGINPHYGRADLHGDLIVMIRPRHADIFGIDAKSGRQLWNSDCPIMPGGVFFSDLGSYILLHSGPSVVIFDKEGNELAYFQSEQPEVPLFGPGIPNLTFFEDRRVIIAKMFVPDHQLGMRSVVIGFDQNWKTGGISTAFFNFEGFSREAGQFVAYSKDGMVGLYKLISD